VRICAEAMSGWSYVVVGLLLTGRERHILRGKNLT
jgi:hypothetical protein